MAYKARNWEAGKSLLGNSFTGSFLDEDNFLDSARSYRAEQEQQNTPVFAGEGIFSGSGTKNMLGGTLEQFDTEMAFGADSLNQRAEYMAAKTLADAQKEAARKEAEGRKAGSIWSTVGQIAGVGLGLALCDERCKVDIGDLGVVEQGDSLAKLAYEVKWLRELA